MRLNSETESHPSTVIDRDEKPASSPHDHDVVMDCDVEVEVVSHSVEVASSHAVTVVPSHPVPSHPVQQHQMDEPASNLETIQASHLANLSDGGLVVDDAKHKETKTLDDTSEVDQIVNRDNDKISVKQLRSVIPRLRALCYAPEEEICGKKKMKNMWLERPCDWPSHVPYMDPNNKGTSERKASKEDLVLMFDFLKGKYIQLQRAGPIHESVCVMSNVHVVQQDQREFPADQHLVVKREVPVSQEPSSTPIQQLFMRCNEKVEALIPKTQDAETALGLKQVFNDILIPLYKASERMETACQFLDAGHQMETLLDVGLMYGSGMNNILREGCRELLANFCTEEPGKPSIVQTYTALMTSQPKSLAPATGEPYLGNLTLRGNVTLNEVNFVPRNTVNGEMNFDDEKKDLKDAMALEKSDADVVKAALEENGINLDFNNFLNTNNFNIGQPEGTSYEHDHDDLLFQRVLDMENEYNCIPAEGGQQQPNNNHMPSFVLGPMSPMSPNGGMSSIPQTVEEMTMDVEVQPAHFQYT